jgi:hypothetical protein
VRRSGPDSSNIIKNPTFEAWIPWDTRLRGAERLDAESQY